MPSHSGAASSVAPDLILVDLTAPLEESLRRLQRHVLDLKSLASALPPNASPATLLDAYTAAPKPLPTSHGDATLTALRRRVTQKLRRLREEQRVDLCAARGSLDTADMDAVLGAAAATRAREPAAPAAANQQQTAQPMEEEEEEDLFGWVTAPAAAPAAKAAPPRVTAPLTAAASAAPRTSVQADAVLQRIAQEVADAVECRYRHASQLEDVHQQLSQTCHSIRSLLTVPRDGQEASNTAPADTLRDLLAHTPSHRIASDTECVVWQRAWQSVSGAAPPLEKGDAVELVDVAVLAQSNAARIARLQERCGALTREYEAAVGRLNRRLAQTALQLEELERRR